MHENFDKSLDLVLYHEGGYVDNPHDPGGATNMGITLSTLRAWRGRDVTKGDVLDLTKTEAGRIYKAKYWDNIRGDELPAGLDYAMFDFAVNSGIRRAAKFLQRLLGVKADGILGPMTLRALTHSSRSVEWLIAHLCQRRLSWLHRLGSFRYFGKGWTRRVRGVQQKALEMSG